MAIGVWAVRMLATPPQPEPDPEELVAVDLAYTCGVCGLALTVHSARSTQPKAPRHCGEEMGFSP